MRPKEIKGLINLDDLVDVQPGAVVSRTLIESDGGTVTLFAFDEGEKLSEHTAPYDALVQIIEGNMKVVLGGEPNSMQAGDSLLMPANVPHSLEALKPTKMLLTMVR